MQPSTLTIAGLVVALAAVVLLGAGARGLATFRHGRWALLSGVVVLPVMVSFASLDVGLARSSRTEFCLQCHEMESFGRSQLVDSDDALAAVHYQNRLVDSERSCYSCHHDYAMFGTVKAKLNGLHHVWVHYFGTVPREFRLYQPYPNSNCLHCHEGARSYLDEPFHRSALAELATGALSCLKCHRVGHDMRGEKARHFWRPE